MLLSINWDRHHELHPDVIKNYKESNGTRNDGRITEYLSFWNNVDIDFTQLTFDEIVLVYDIFLF